MRIVHIIKYREWFMLGWGIIVIALTVVTLAYGDPTPIRAAGNIFYVDNTHVDCDDSYTTVQNDIDHPWCTVARANTAHTSGDTVMIKGEYREELIPKPGVNTNQPTIYSGYSSDYSQTVILGSDEINPASWSLYSGSIYRAQFSAPTQCRYDGSNTYSIHNTNCWVDRQTWLLRADPTVQEDSLSALNQAGEYYYDDATDYLYVWLADSSDPASHVVECSQRPILRVGEYSSNPSVYHFELRNMTLMQSNGRALTFSPYEDDPGDITIENNKIAFTTGDSYCLGNPAAIYNGSATGGAYLPNTPGYEIKDNIIHDAGSDRGPSYGDWRFEAAHNGAGIEWYGVMDSRIEGNEFYNMAQPIALKRGDINITVSNNIIHDAREGIWLGWPTATGQFAATIEGNLIYNITSRTDQKASGYAVFNGCGDNQYNVYNNTLVNTSGLHVTTEADAQGGCNLDAAYLTAKNNIISNLVPTYTSPTGTRFISLYWNSFSNTVSNYNLFYHQAVPSAFVMRTPGNRSSTLTTYATLANWQTASNQDLDSAQSDPLFVNAGLNNYGLQSGSPAIDEGEIINGYHCPQSDDVNPSQTNCRHWQGTAPDVGAFEYANAPPDLTAPIISNVTTGTPTTATIDISWSTNEAATTQIEYGLTDSYGSQTTVNNYLVQYHTQFLSGLTPGTLYHFRVKSQDGSNNLAISGDYTFTTAQTCTESWTCDSWTSCVQGNQTRTCTDTNACGTALTIPALSQSCISPCVESWTCDSWTSCVQGNQTRTCTDTNACGTNTNRPDLTIVCTNNPLDDNPNTLITINPSGVTTTPIAEFQWSGTDDVTAGSELNFSYSLDGAPWSAWSQATSVRFTRLRNGLHTFVVRSKDAVGQIDESPAVISWTIQVDEKIVVVPNTGGAPHVRTFSTTGKLLGQFFAYETEFRGGLSVATADLGGDGTSEIIIAPGPGREPLVKIFRQDGSLINQFFAYAQTFRGGVNVAAGDFDNNGVVDIVTSPMTNGGPHVRIFKYSSTGYVPLARDIVAYDANFRGGLSIAACDIEGDGYDDIVVIPASRGAAHLRLFSLRNGQFVSISPGIFTYATSYRGGVTLACGDINGDSLDEVVTSTVSGGPHVRAFGRTKNGVIGLIHPGFLAFQPQFRGGVSVATGNMDYDSRADIYASVLSQGSPLIRMYSIQNPQFIRREFFGFPTVSLHGIRVAGMR